MKIYIGNLADGTTLDEVKELFRPFNKDAAVTLVCDKETGAFRGYAYVEVDSKKDGQNAITGLHGLEFKGNALVVNKAQARPPAHGRTPGFGSGGHGATGGNPPKFGGVHGKPKAPGGFSNAGKPNRTGQRGS